MSKQDTQSAKTTTLSINQNRSDFIDYFKEKHNLNKTITSNERGSGRWNFLYNQSKLMQAKKEEYRKKQIELRDYDIFSECTFNPEIYKHKYNKTDYLSNYNSVSKSQDKFNFTLPIRQKSWAEKRKLNIEKIKEKSKQRELNECLFHPEVNEIKKGVNLKTSAVNLLEDPESYKLYIERLVKKRKNDETTLKRQKSLPGSGNIWTAKPKNYNLNYDYTKHEISSRGMRVKNLSRPSTPGKLSSCFCSPKKIQMQDKDRFYEYLYKNQRKNKVIIPKNDNIKKGSSALEQENKMLRFNREIDFGKALEILHSQLYSIKLMKED